MNPNENPNEAKAANAAPQQTGTIRAAAKAGLAAARANALPGLFLWALAAAIVAGFYLLPPVTAALEALGRVKAAGGFLYSAIATSLFGGLIPFLWITFANRKRNPVPHGSATPASSDAAESAETTAPAWQRGLFLSLFWAWKGVEVDLLYRGQDLLFGTGATADKIIPKVVVDQFVYNPLWAGWTQVLAYWWLANRFRPAALVDRALWGSMGQRVITVLISTWGVWIPMVSIIYAMPANLQIPLFNIALCFWSLMLAALTKEKNHR